LVDYFYGVGDFLRQFDGNLVEVPFTILQDGYSVKTQKHVDCTVYVDNGQYQAQWSNFKQTTLFGSAFKKDYKRKPGPLSYGFLVPPQFRMPSLKQAGNIVSLIIARMQFE